jgi:beta-ureidopropionase / N-carbamoyl-L-amino-acid hydrolase
MGDAMLRINPTRLRARLERMSEFGRPPGGTFADGVTRVGYSEADRAARAWLSDLMKAAGLDVRVDAAANLIGRKEGRDTGAAPILFGSHSDSVIAGGNFDGSLGVLGAIEAAQTLIEQGVATDHPLEVVVWTNEEGVAYGDGLCGSRAAAGEMTASELEKIWNGVRKADAIRGLGGDPDRLEGARRAPGSVHAYLELHIEQGHDLERAGVPIGVVQGIVAIHRYECVVHGVANHAGTTAMGDRRDALLAASRLVEAVHEIVTGRRGRHVGTVGRLDVEPNAPNVIPGTVSLTVEFRDLAADVLRDLAEEFRARADGIAAATGTTIDMEPSSLHRAALASPDVQAAVAKAADGLGLEHVSFASGAGHDAQIMRRLGRMGMIFVPSAGGVSHSPREWTSWEDCASGADVLLASVLALDELQSGAASGI